MTLRKKRKGSTFVERHRESRRKKMVSGKSRKHHNQIRSHTKTSRKCGGGKGNTCPASLTGDKSYRNKPGANFCCKEKRSNWDVCGGYNTGLWCERNETNESCSIINLDGTRNDKQHQFRCYSDNYAKREGRNQRNYPRGTVSEQGFVDDNDREFVPSDEQCEYNSGVNNLAKPIVGLVKGIVTAPLEAYKTFRGNKTKSNSSSHVGRDAVGKGIGAAAGDLVHQVTGFGGKRHTKKTRFRKK